MNIINKESDEVLQREAKKLEDKLQIHTLTNDNAKVVKTNGGFVSLEYDGEKYDRVNFYCAFPLTDPENFISVRENTEEAREIGIIESLSDFPQEIVGILKEQMNMRYFMPKIKSINSVKQEYGFAYWSVGTDRGECRFTLSMHGGAIAQLSETRLILTDIDGNRFEVPDTTQLTPTELKKIDLYL